MRCINEVQASNPPCAVYNIEVCKPTVDVVCIGSGEEVTLVDTCDSSVNHPTNI